MLFRLETSVRLTPELVLQPGINLEIQVKPSTKERLMFHQGLDVGHELVHMLESRLAQMQLWFESPFSSYVPRVLQRFVLSIPLRNLKACPFTIGVACG